MQKIIWKWGEGDSVWSTAVVHMLIWFSGGYHCLVLARRLHPHWPYPSSAAPSVSDASCHGDLQNKALVLPLPLSPEVCSSQDNRRGRGGNLQGWRETDASRNWNRISMVAVIFFSPDRISCLFDLTFPVPSLSSLCTIQFTALGGRSSLPWILCSIILFCPSSLIQLIFSQQAPWEKRPNKHLEIKWQWHYAAVPIHCNF